MQAIFLLCVSEEAALVLCVPVENYCACQCPQVLGLGLLEETAFLLSQGISGSDDGSAPGSMAGKAVGYRQALDWLLEVGEGVWVCGCVLCGE